MAAMEAAAASAKQITEQKLNEKAESCRERLGYPFKVVGSYLAVACCIGEFSEREWALSLLVLALTACRADSAGPPKHRDSSRSL